MRDDSGDPAPVLFIAFDATEAALIDEWATAGMLPAFAALDRAAASFALDNCLDTLPGAIWPDITTGRSSARTGVFFHPKQIKSGEARFRPVDAARLPAPAYFPHVAARAGRRVACFDLPQVPRDPASGALQILEWGTHDMPFGRGAEPPGLLDDVRARFGAYPAAQCDSYGESEAGLASLREALRAGAQQKTAIARDLLAQEAWDLFAVAFTEGHCAGHQFWNRHAAGDADDPLAEIYRELDRALAALLDAVPPETRVLCLTSHGMGPYVSGPPLLAEFLARLGYASGGAGRAAGVVRALQRTAKYVVPRRFWEAAQRALVFNPLVGRAVTPLQARAGCRFHPFEDAATRAAPVDNNRIGAIRLNIKGRDPEGTVAPGNEAASLLEEIREALFELVDPDSGEAIVERAVTTPEAFGMPVHPDCPDLLVVFRRDLGCLDAARSPRTGTIRVTRGSISGRRSGDHTDTTRLWVRAPGLAPGRRAARPNSLDIAPTVLDLLGVPAPPDLDGQAIDLAAAVDVAAG